MKTVLHVLRMNSFSGAENVAITMINGFQRYRQGEYRFIYSSPEGSIRSVVEENGIEFEAMREFGRSEIRRIIEKVKPDIIHAHDFTASTICAFVAGRIPVISHIHNNSPWIKKLCINSITFGLSCFKYKSILGVSTSVFDEYIFGKYFHRKEFVIGNPVDISKVQRMASQAPCVCKYDVAFVGRLTPPKKPILFLQVVSKVKKKLPSLSVVMIGDGELRNEVEKEIKRLGIENTVTMTGFLKNPYGILSASKMLCMTSAWEGFGLVAAEALALGKPVVATPVGGIPSIIQGKEGTLTADTEVMAETITNILLDNQRYEAMHLAALKRADEIDNLKKYIQKVEIHY